jgi:methionine synthase I (cobalamin-dependent)
VLLDAAMGTRLIARGLDLARDDPCLWNLDRPEEVLDVHRRDIRAGSDAVLTNTFGANRAWLVRLGRADRVAALNRGAVALARRAAGPGRFVVGCLGPSAAAEPDAYREQADALAEAGADALILETHRVDQAVRGLKVLHLRTDLPVLVGLAARPGPGDGPPGCLVDLGASALGCNCLFGMEPMLDAADHLARALDLPLIAKPSAGLPDGRSASPGSFADAVPALLARGVRLFGGCCGATEAHVAALRAALDRGSRPGPGAGRRRTDRDAASRSEDHGRGTPLAATRKTKPAARSSPPAPACATTARASAAVTSRCRSRRPGPGTITTPSAGTWRTAGPWSTSRRGRGTSSSCRAAGT